MKNLESHKPGDTLPHVPIFTALSPVGGRRKASQISFAFPSSFKMGAFEPLQSAQATVHRV